MILSHHLSLLLCLPLAGALLVLCVPDRRGDAVRWLASSVALAGFLLSTPFWFAYDPGNPDFQFVERARWIPWLGAQYVLGLDGISTLLVLLTTLMGCIATLASWSSISGRVKEHYVTLLVLQTGMLGTFMALDALLFFVFWEVALVAMYFLIAIWGSPARTRSATRFLVSMLTGSVALLLGILALAFQSRAVRGAFSFDITTLQALSVPFDVQWWIFLAFFIGFAIAVPLFPLHSWLPDAHSDAPTAGSIILGAVMLKMGTYGFLRFSLPMLPEATRYFVPFVAALSMIGIVYGAFVALAQKDWKRLVACSSVSHMGMVMLGMMVMSPVGLTGSLVQQIDHGIAIGALFLLVGFIHDRRHIREIAAYGGLSRVMPAFAVVFLVMSLFSIGLPTPNGWVGEFLILKGAFTHSRGWAAAAGSGIVLGAAYMFSLYRRTMLGAVTNVENARLPDLRAREWLTVAPLVALAGWMVMYPAPFVERVNLSALKIAARVDASYAAEFAAACDTTVTDELKAAAPGNQFLAAAPCGPDGQPLAPGTVVPGVDPPGSGR
ncbi:MAG TPA: NADH-quinone oxidoreductase subunit M [Vicinamibacterales bacterium]|nr:NADH-quinone oxidoreductase subunit M [Vicinamibacterales bacterium]